MRPCLLAALLLIPLAAARAASPVGAEASFPAPGRAVVAFDVPAGHELFLDSLGARVAPDGPALAPGAHPAAAGADELGREYASGAFSVAFSSDEPFPAGAEIAVSFQACGPDMCFPPETRRFAAPGAATNAAGAAAAAPADEDAVADAYRDAVDETAQAVEDAAGEAKDATEDAADQVEEAEDAAEVFKEKLKSIDEETDEP